jgi:hypothetical protein
MTDSMDLPEGLPERDDEWAKVRDEDLIDLTESVLAPSAATVAAQTQRFMERNLLTLVKNIYDIAMNSPSDRTRLQASQYLIDRVMGRVDAASTRGALPGAGSAPWESVYNEVVIQEPSRRELGR